MTTEQTITYADARDATIDVMTVAIENLDKARRNEPKVVKCLLEMYRVHSVLQDRTKARLDNRDAILSSTRPVTFARGTWSTDDKQDVTVWTDAIRALAVLLDCEVDTVLAEIQRTAVQGRSAQSGFAYAVRRYLSE